MNQYMFYSEDELSDIVTKRNGNISPICGIKEGDTTIKFYDEDEGSWVEKTVDDFIEFAFPNKNYLGISTAGGMFVFPDDESKEHFISTHNIEDENA